jgi:hypothetical protein
MYVNFFGHSKVILYKDIHLLDEYKELLHKFMFIRRRVNMTLTQIMHVLG